MSLRALQTAAAGVGIASAVLGFLASVGQRLFPAGDPAYIGIVHLLLAALGAACGVAATLRNVEIERQRWEYAEDPLATKVQREYAHKETEVERRLAGVSFLGCPVLLGYWMAYQFAVEPYPLTVALVPVTTLAATALGYFVSQKRFGGD
jgi:hypothetical protein